MARDQLSEADAHARIEAQWPLARKRELVDRVIDNSHEPQALGDELKRALNRLS
jgi:dephospho-CoA kinase